MISAAKLKKGDKLSLQIVAVAIELCGSFSKEQVSLRAKGPIPRLMKQAFGGTYFLHHQKNEASPYGVFRIRGEKAMELLRLLSPYFLFRRPAAKFTLAAPKQASPHS